MAFNYDDLLRFSVPDKQQDLTQRDSILYALGIGLGGAPTSPEELRYVYEDGLIAFPTMSVVLAHPGFWMRDPAAKIDWVKVVHGEQGMVLHRPLPVSGRLVGRTRITDIFDKGLGKGAVVRHIREVFDADTDEHLCTLAQSTFCRGDGGCGGPGGSPPKPAPPPQRAPDHRVDLATLPQAALIYRLSGDYNPLHADPAAAARAGYEKPILHGLCSFGVAGRALVSSLPENSTLQEMSVRFTAVAYPGETLSTRIWDEGAGQIAFETYVGDRMVLGGGRARAVTKATEAAAP